MNIAAPVPEDSIAGFLSEIPDHKDVIVGELAKNGEWIVANISTNSFWPVTSQKVRWRDCDIWIMPIMKGFYPAVAMMVQPGKSRAECEELVMRFLSMLSWVEERGFMVEGGGFSGGNLPRPMGRDKEGGFSICDELDLSYFPEVTDEKAMLALALMREGRGLNHVGYAFLSFYRVLEVAFTTDTKRIAWISAALSNLTGHGVKEALDSIKEHRHRLAPIPVGPLRDGACQPQAHHRSRSASRHSPAEFRTAHCAGFGHQGDRRSIWRRDPRHQLPQTSL